MPEPRTDTYHSEAICWPHSNVYNILIPIHGNILMLSYSLTESWYHWNQ